MSRRIDVGFIPLLDAAPLIVALEIGFAAEEGLDLALHREMSWASLRDRLIWGRYHAAHMLAPVVVAQSAGLGAGDEPFDALIPEQLPGTARQWSIGSGYAELATAALLLMPRTRRIGGAVSAALFVGVWPGNMKMAWDSRHASPTRQAIAYGRLPLQIPLIVGAVKIARNA